MKTKKVYIVKESSGAYDDYMEWINSVWDAPEAAEKRKEEIIAWNKKAIDTPPPYTEEEIRIGNLNDDQFTLYNDWYTEWSNARECNVPTVETHEIQY
jgi:hypothetical protein